MGQFEGPTVETPTMPPGLEFEITFRDPGKCEFEKEQRICRDLCASKHLDYGPENINAGGICGLIVRMGDKQRRLEHLTRKVPMQVGKDPEAFERWMQHDGAHHESLADTLRDMANYAVIMLLFMQDKWGLTAREIYGKALDKALDTALSIEPEEDQQ